MNNYIATFFSHYGALAFCKALAELGIDAKPMPVPRKLSSSCGTCVRFCADEPPDLCSDEMEAVYVCENDGYRLIIE